MPTGTAQPREPDDDPRGQGRQRERDGPGGKGVEGKERGSAAQQTARLPKLQPPLLPEVERRESRCERESGEGGEDEADVQREERARVTAPLAEAGASAHACKHEQPGGERHHREAEQAVPGAAAPDQIRADDEPDEEVERAGPGGPRKAVGPRGLADE